MGRSRRPSDETLALVRRELYSAVVGDVMDEVGLLRQFLPAGIRPVEAGMRVVGLAMPVTVEDVSPAAPPAYPGRPFGLMLEALDDLKRDEVYVCGGRCPEYALWGELMSTRARTLGSAGAVLDGYYRDTDGIIDLEFPTFGYGAYAQDQRGRGHVVDYRTRIGIGQVSIAPGDLVVGDRDGVCVVPRADIDEVVHLALGKVSGENRVRSAIRAGMSSQDAFAKYGVM